MRCTVQLYDDVVSVSVCQLATRAAAHRMWWAGGMCAGLPAEGTSGGLPARLALMNEFLDLGPREQAPLEHHRVSLKTVGRHVATFLFGVVVPSTETASWMWFHPKAW